MIDVFVARRLWEQLHTFARGQKISQDLFLNAWLADVQSMLNCETCFKKLVRFVQLWPPDSDLNLWAICLHDYVNKEMGKPLFFPELTLAPLFKRGITQ